jgi:hypothetical protein
MLKEISDSYLDAWNVMVVTVKQVVVLIIVLARMFYVLEKDDVLRICMVFKKTHIVLIIDKLGLESNNMHSYMCSS